MEKNKRMMFIIIALLVVLLAVIVGISVFAFRVINADKIDPAEVASSAEVPILQTDKAISSAINVNLKMGLDGKAHAINVEVEVYMDASDKKNADLVAKIKESEAIIRDAVISVIRNKTIEEVKDDDATDIIKQEILTKLQEEFKTNIIYRVYFKSYFFSA